MDTEKDGLDSFLQEGDRMMLNTSNVTANSTTALFNIVPILLFIYPFIKFYIWFTGMDIDNGWNLPQATEPEGILKMRYARGEIDSFEYVERLSRL